MAPIKAKAAAPEAMVLLGTTPEDLELVCCACATWYPKLVATVWDPLMVVVYTLEAVVLAVQAVQLVHGALELQVPLVQPGQLEAGHLSLSHHEVHAPDVHGPAEPNGPHCPPPKGAPLTEFQPPGPTPNCTPKPGPPKPPNPPVGAGPYWEVKEE